MADKIRRRQGLTYSLDKRKVISPDRRIYKDGAGLEKMNNASKTAAKKAFGDVGSAVGSVSAVLGAAGTMLDTFNKNAEIADTSGIQSDIDEVASNNFEEANDYASILDAESNMQDLKTDYTRSDVRGGSIGERLVNTFGAVSSGAGAGATVGGPWGAIAGAAAGLGSGIAGWITGGDKAKKEAERLNREAERANARQQNAYNSKVEALNASSWQNSLANIAAHGGYLHKFSGDDDFLFSTPNLANPLISVRDSAGNITSAIGRASIPWIDQWNMNRLSTGNFDRQLGNGNLELQKRNRDNTPVTLYLDDYLITPDTKQTAGGYYDRTHNHIYLGGVSLSNTNDIHEGAHASQALPQETVIGDILKNTNYKDKYLDNSSEVYSRLMEMRRHYNLDPKKTYKRKDLKEMRQQGKSKFNMLDRYDDDTLLRLMNEVADNNTDIDYTNYAANGGEIHIKPSKRGTFTAAAKKRGMGVQEFASKVLANKDSYSPAMVKKANFARNFGGRKHDLGGYLFTHGADWNNGVTKVDAGGSHEMNPYEGVPMGIAPDGAPNLVEQGEVIYNDYVFSNRLTPDKKDLKKAGLPENYKNSSFAYIAEDMAKESEERPNDPISRRGLEASLGKLAAVQEMQRQRKGKKGTQQMMAFGGRKYAGTYDNPPVDFSVPYGPENLSENYPIFYPAEEAVYLPREKNSISTKTESAQTKSSTSASKQSVSKKQLTPAERDTRPLVSAVISLDSFIPENKVVAPEVKPDMNAVWDRVAAAQRERRSSEESDSLSTFLRYAPALGSALGALYSAFQKPDYSNADRYFQEAANLPRESVQARTLNNYLTYKPLDRNYYLNQLKGQAGATRRAIMNSGSNPGQVMANLLAADYNAQNAVGNTLMQMDRYNQEQKERTASFNRGTDQYNSQALMQADAQNAALARQRAAMRNDLINRGILMREQADQALEASRNLNFTNLFDNLGGIGRENFAMNQVNSGQWVSKVNPDGTQEFKTAARGGMLTKRNRRRK